MKRITKFFTVLLIIATALASFASCSEGRVAKSGKAKIVVENGENDYTVYDVDLSELKSRDEGAMSLLEHVASKEGSPLYYNVQWGGGYGAYITSIGSLSPNPQNQFIALYTSEKSDFAVPTEWTPEVPTVKYGGMTLTYSGVGLSSMSIKDGTVILFRLEGF